MDSITFQNNLAKSIVKGDIRTFHKRTAQLLSDRATAEDVLALDEILKNLDAFVEKVQWNETSPKENEEITDIVKDLEITKLLTPYKPKRVRPHKHDRDDILPPPKVHMSCGGRL